MQRILQLTQTKEFRGGESSLIKHVIFPQPLIHYINKPYSRDKLKLMMAVKILMKKMNALNRLFFLVYIF